MEMTKNQKIIVIILSLCTIMILAMVLGESAPEPEHSGIDRHKGVMLISIKPLSNGYCETSFDGGLDTPDIMIPDACNALQLGSCYDYAHDVEKWLEIDCRTGDWI